MTHFLWPDNEYSTKMEVRIVCSSISDGNMYSKDSLRCRPFLLIRMRAGKFLGDSINEG